MFDTYTLALIVAVILGIVLACIVDERKFKEEFNKLWKD